jgi:predicted nucleic acid-binding protein
MSISYIVDASVAIKWVLPEIHSDRADRLLITPDLNLIAPEFIFVEMSNILWKKVQQKQLIEDDAIEALRALQDDMPLIIYSTGINVNSALSIALELKRAVYDCLYLSMAVERGIQFVTADSKFYEALKHGKYKNNLLWIEDIP